MTMYQAMYHSMCGYARVVRMFGSARCGELSVAAILSVLYKSVNMIKELRIIQNSSS